MSAFTSITPGPGTVTVDPTDVGLGLQGLTLVSATNANVTIPSFPFGTNLPVTATFTQPNPSQPVDFTLRASSRLHAVLIRAQCGAARPDEGPVSRAAGTGIPFWVPTQTAGSLDGLVSSVYYVFGRKEAEEAERP